MDLLRFFTAGSVDDGKSTLIGRLLYDSKSVFQEHLEAIEGKGRVADGELNLALLTDGLKAEREQGITIDVAYKYFATPKRKFIIADTPGHIQYTRNMVTGASNAHAAIILIDARNGVIEQTRRHSYIAALLRIPHLIVCVNKMDLVEYGKEIFEKIQEEYKSFSARLDIHDVSYIPISALKGDNIVQKSTNMSWYTGRPLLEHLEELAIEGDENLTDARFPVQYVIRPQSEAYPDYRGYAGLIRSGIFRKGEKLTILPSGFETEIQSIEFDRKEIPVAFAPMSVIIRVRDNLDISRGDMFVKSENQPMVTQDVEAIITWMDTIPLNLAGQYFLQHTTNRVRAVVKEIEYKININTSEKITDDSTVKLNDICRVRIRTAKPIFADDYSINRATGSAILVDSASNNTVAAVIISKRVIT